MWQLPQQPLTMKQVLAESYALFKDAVGKLHVVLTLFFVLLATPYIVMPLINHVWLDFFTPYYEIKVGILIFIYTLFVFWFYGAFYHQLNVIMRIQPASAKASLTAVLKKMPALIAAFIVAAIANFAGMIIFLIPGIYFLVIITLYYPLIVIDDLGPIRGFKQALHLVLGDWWRSALVMVVPVLLSFLIMFGVGIVLFLCLIVFRPSAPVMEIFFIYMQIALAVLFLPMSAVVNSVQIYNLKLRKSAVSSEPMKPDLQVING